MLKPAKNQKCVFEFGLDASGRARKCDKAATVVLEGKPLCDRHAELRMTVLCGRHTVIRRD